MPAGGGPVRDDVIGQLARADEPELRQLALVQLDRRHLAGGQLTAVEDEAQCVSPARLRLAVVDDQQPTRTDVQAELFPDLTPARGQRRSSLLDGAAWHLLRRLVGRLDQQHVPRAPRRLHIALSD
jgi:hypothetical protein